MSDSEDSDVPALSAETFAALQEFYKEQNEREELMSRLQTDSELKDNIVFDEDWQLSQFWYDESTVRSLVRAVDRVLVDGGRAALVSCPTLYVPLKKHLNGRAQVTLFEFDRRFEVYAPDFVLYDYKEPARVPAGLAGTYDVVVGDPPFLADECLSKVAHTVALLARPAASLVICTGSVMRERVNELLGLKECQFQVQHRNGLSNDFSCYANFDLDSILK